MASSYKIIYRYLHRTHRLVANIETINNRMTLVPIIFTILKRGKNSYNNEIMLNMTWQRIVKVVGTSYMNIMYYYYYYVICIARVLYTL